MSLNCCSNCAWNCRLLLSPYKRTIAAREPDWHQPRIKNSIPQSYNPNPHELLLCFMDMVLEGRDEGEPSSVRKPALVTPARRTAWGFAAVAIWILYDRVGARHCFWQALDSVCTTVLTAVQKSTHTHAHSHTHTQTHTHTHNVCVYLSVCLSVCLCLHASPTSASTNQSRLFVCCLFPDHFQVCCGHSVGV